MLRNLVSRIGDLLVPLLPRRCKEMLVNRKLDAMEPELLAAPRRIAEADARRFQFSPLQIPPRGPDPLTSSADL
jgi:hypothetical protein